MTEQKSPERRLRLGMVGGGEGAFDHRDGGLPDFLRVMLDPAVAGVVLGEFPLIDRHRTARPVEQDGAAAGGALVDGEDIRLFRHGPSAPVLSFAQGLFCREFDILGA